jgi:hypothetical protein
MDKLLSIQEHILNIAATNQIKSDEYHIQQRSRGQKTEFPIQSYVLYADPSGLKISGNSKLSTPLKGPFRVVNRIRSKHQSSDDSGDIYVIENLISHEMKDVQVHHLRPFEYNSENVDPLEVAMTDNQEFLIEKILAHEPNLPPNKFMKLRKEEMRFLVKYIGYETPESNTWDNLRKTEQLHNYLRANGMKSLVPAAYRLNVLIKMRAYQIQYR